MSVLKYNRWHELKIKIGDVLANPTLKTWNTITISDLEFLLEHSGDNLEALEVAEGIAFDTGYHEAKAKYDNSK